MRTTINLRRYVVRRLIREEVSRVLGGGRSSRRLTEAFNGNPKRAEDTYKALIGYLNTIERRTHIKTKQQLAKFYLPSIKQVMEDEYMDNMKEAAELFFQVQFAGIVEGDDIDDSNESNEYYQYFEQNSHRYLHLFEKHMVDLYKSMF